MFVDLHEGILEIFEEVQQLVDDAVDAKLLCWSLRLRERQRRYQRRHNEKVTREIRQLRASCPPWSTPKLAPTPPAVRGPAPISVVLVTCPKCSSLVEHRKGCRDVVNHRCREKRAAQGVP